MHVAPLLLGPSSESHFAVESNQLDFQPMHAASLLLDLSHEFRFVVEDN